MEKYEKTCFYAETNDFDQQKACGAPVWWLKYTTPSYYFELVFYTSWSGNTYGTKYQLNLCEDKMKHTKAVFGKNSNR